MGFHIARVRAPSSLRELIYYSPGTEKARRRSIVVHVTTMPKEVKHLTISVNDKATLTIDRTPTDVSSLVLSGSNHIVLQNPLLTSVEVHLQVEVKALFSIEQALRRIPFDPDVALDLSSFAVSGEARADAGNLEHDLELLKIKPSGICPITLQKISVPGKGVSCEHSMVFDVRSYLILGITTNSWKCPICAVDLYPEDLIRT